MSGMTASGSKPSTSRQPHNIPLPPSPEKSTSYHNSKKRKTGKEKEQSNPPPQHRVGQDEWDHSRAGTQTWQWVSLTDSSVGKHPPIFTKDGSYFFAFVGSSIKIHSCATGRIVSTLTGKPIDSQSVGNADSSDVITSAVLNPKNPYQLITGSLEGYIRIWDFLDASLLQTISIEQPIFNLCAHENFPDYVFVAVAKRTQKLNSNGREKEANGVVLRVSLKPRSAATGHKVQSSSEITSIGKTRAVVGLSFSPSGGWLVAVAGHKAYVASTSSFKSGFTKFVSPEALTCLAFHPSEDYFATGDDKGNIRLWYCLNEQVAAHAVGVEKKAQTTTLHWHAHAVSSIAFTPNGAYLLSGGEESVLVVWQLHSGKKEFVPRVGASINAIAVVRGGQSEEYLLGLADATFAFVSAATLKISRSYSRIKLDPEASHRTFSSAPLAVHSSTATLILPSSHSSSLQIYAPSTSTLMSELEVSHSNRVSRRDEAPIESSRVECAIISSSGEWMATIDSREGGEAFRGEVYLKIWRWNTQTSFWTLNTRIDRPHGLERVTSVGFSPEVKDRLGLQLVTTGDDRAVKIWRLRTTTERHGDVEESWVARSTLAFRGELPRHASWSPDGSLLCVTMGSCVSLYDSASNVLRRVLTSPNCKAPTSAQFVGRSGRYLAVVSVWEVVLWDLPAQSVRWHLKNPWPIDKILCHPRDDTFALLHSPSISPILKHPTTPIALFRPLSSLPYKKCTVPFGFLNVVWHPASWSASPLGASSYSLVGITNKYSVVLFGDDISAPAAEGSRANAIVGATLGQRRTLFQDIFGTSAFTNPSPIPKVDSSSVSTDIPWSGNDTAELFDAPAYLMPPIESLFAPLMDSFLKPRSKHEEKYNVRGNEQQGEDIEMGGQSDDEPIIVRERRERVVDQKEMDMFMELFQHTKISSNQTAVSKVHDAVPQVNGKYHTTPSNSKVNGVKRHISTAQLSPGVPAKDIPALSFTPNDDKKTQKRRRSSESS